MQYFLGHSLRLTVIGGALLAAACAGGPRDRGAEEYLEEASGLTITRVAAPLVLYADDPALAANARDYVYAAPLAVNRTGERSYWMWLSLWSTIDRGSLAGDVDPAQIRGVQLLLDGEPVDLDIDARRAAIAGLRRAPYATPVATARSFYLPLSASQVARLAGAREIALHVDLGGEPMLWRQWAAAPDGLRDFARLTGAVVPAGPATAATHER